MTTQGEYAVGGGANITLTVTFGDGQRGRAAVLVDEQEIARGSDRFTASLGPAATLRGKTVAVVGVVNRTSPSPRCSVTYEFSGGAGPAEFRGDANFDEDGEPIDVDGTFPMI